MMIDRRTLLRLTAAGTMAATTFTASTSRAMAGEPGTRTLEISNAGFEEPATGGTIPGWEQTFGSTGFSVTDRAAEGNQALAVGNTAEVVGLLSSAAPVVPGHYYAATVQGSWTTGRPQLYLYFYDAAGGRIAESNRSYTGMPTADWCWYGIGAHAPTGAVTARVLIYSAVRPADFVVDDVRLTETHGRIETFGHAAEEVATIGMTSHRGKHYVTTRNQRPAVLGEYDLATETLTGRWELPEADGAYGLAAQGDKVYVGAHLSGRVYVLDLVTREVTALPTFGQSDTDIFGMVIADDGLLYCATYPDCGLWRVDPTTGAATRIAELGEEAYARSIAVEGQHLVVGTSPGGRLHHVDLTTDDIGDITPDTGRRSGYVTCDIHDGTVWAANAATVVSLGLDGSGARTWDLPGSQIDALRVMPDGAVFATVRPAGSVHRLAPGEEEFTELGAGEPGGEHLNIVPADDGVVALAVNGNLWSWSDAAGFTSHQLRDTEMKGATLIQALCQLPNGMIAASGSDVHIHLRPLSGDAPVYVPIAATPIRLAATREALWVATYPRTEIVRVPVGTWKPEILGSIGNGQYRPWTMYVDHGRSSLVIGTEPSLGTTEGAVTLFHLTDHTFTTHHAPLGEQSITAALGVGSRTFLGGGQAADRQPRVGEIDLDTGEVLWSIVPVPGLSTIESLAHRNGILYGVVRGNAWFALDLETREVIRTGWLSGTHSYGNISIVGGRVILPTHKGVMFEIDLDRQDSLVLMDGYAEGWRRAPQFWCNDRTGTVWGLSGMQLARFDLDGSHLPTTD